MLQRDGAHIGVGQHAGVLIQADEVLQLGREHGLARSRHLWAGLRLRLGLRLGNGCLKKLLNLRWGDARLQLRGHFAEHGVVQPQAGHGALNLRWVVQVRLNPLGGLGHCPAMLRQCAAGRGNAVTVEVGINFGSVDAGHAGAQDVGQHVPAGCRAGGGCGRLRALSFLLLVRRTIDVDG